MKGRGVVEYMCSVAKARAGLSFQFEKIFV